jgi:hypothetical protein
MRSAVADMARAQTGHYLWRAGLLPGTGPKGHEQSSWQPCWDGESASAGDRLEVERMPWPGRS